MNRYQFFSLLEASHHGGGRSKRPEFKSYRRAPAPTAAAHVTHPSRTVSGQIKTAAQGVGSAVSDMASKAGTHISNLKHNVMNNPKLLTAAAHTKAAGKTAVKFMRKNPKATVAAATAGLAGIKHLMSRRASSAPGKLAQLRAIIARNPKKAAAAGTAGLASLMFLRKKNKDK